MSSSTNSNSTSATVQVGPGFCGLLTIAFIVLKLMGYITWSWWWVFAPIWIPAIFVLIVLAIFVIGVAAVATLND